MKICKKGLNLIKSAVLSVGAHTMPPDIFDPNCEKCVMELASQVEMVCKLHEDASWSDHPITVCPIIAAFCRAFNDKTDDAGRDTPLTPPMLESIICPDTQWYLNE